MRKNLKIYLIIFIVLFIVITSISIFSDDSVHASPKKITNTNTIFVDIKGAVKKPGVYEVKEGSRVIDVIKKAGDLKKDADTSIINLSKRVKDEMFIIIYTKDQISEYKEKYNSSSTIVKEVEEKIICPDTDNEACINTDSKSAVSGKININEASLEDLKTLTGIGEGKAKKIIEYRNKTKFESIEDIKNVSGIGDSLFEKIKNNIEV